MNDMEWERYCSKMKTFCDMVTTAIRIQIPATKVQDTIGIRTDDVGIYIKSVVPITARDESLDEVHLYDSIGITLEKEILEQLDKLEGSYVCLPIALAEDRVVFTSEYAGLFIYFVKGYNIQTMQSNYTAHLHLLEVK